MDKVYAVDDINFFDPGRHRAYGHVLIPEDRLSLELSPGSSGSVVLPVGDDVAACSVQGALSDLSLRIYVERFTYKDKVEFRLNGKVLDTEVLMTTDGASPVACGTFMLRAKPDPSSIKKGDNKFEALLKKRCESAPGLPVITAVQLVIRYKI